MPFNTFAVTDIRIYHSWKSA